jgi:hypothetical protein
MPKKPGGPNVGVRAEDGSIVNPRFYSKTDTTPKARVRTGGKRPARKTKEFWTGPKGGGYEDEYPAYPGARFPLSKVPRTDSVRSRAYTVRNQQKQSPDSGVWGAVKKVSNAVGLTDDKQWDASELAKIARKKRLKGKGG